MESIDERLKTDSHALLKWKNCFLRLHKNATLPWIIIIPDTGVVEYCDLSVENQLTITHISRLISDYFKTSLNVEKINFAAIGNVVQQLHIHVVGRNAAGPLWPDVVWGNPLPEASYCEADLAHWRATCKTILEETV